MKKLTALLVIFCSIAPVLQAQLLHEISGQEEFVTTTPLSTLPS